MKKLLIVFLVVFTLLGLISCGEDSTSNTGSSKKPTNSLGTEESNISGSSGTENSTQDTPTGLEFTLSSDESYYILSSLGTCEDSVIAIPNIYNGLPVQTIGNRAFYECTSLKKVIIPSSVTTIEDYAFMGCTSLETVNIPVNVISMGYYAFYNCTKLSIFCERRNEPTKWDDDYSWDSDWNKTTCPVIWDCISYGVTDGYEWKELYTRPNSVEIIRYSGNETELIVPRTINGLDVVSIGENAFYHCHKLKSITLPIYIERIYNNAISPSVEMIYCEAIGEPLFWFSKWNSERPVIWGQNNITTNKEYDYVVHNDKAYLTNYKGTSTEISVPDRIDGYTVVSFGNIFNKNDSLQKLTIPQTVTSINSYAFYYCESLEEVLIPNSVARIGESAFYSYSTLYCQAEYPYVGWAPDWSKGDLNSVIWGYSTTNPEYDYALENGLAYLLTYKGNDTDIVIPEAIDGHTVFRFGEIFKGNVNIKSITIPKHIDKIDNEAFANCINLEKLLLEMVLRASGSLHFQPAPLLRPYPYPIALT